ncbi:Ser/Thr protein phosphatase family protein [Planktothrix serta PCC 8927]|uniref:Ser/Thr protein phosphatase family protein n=1 Tax=Planktothrix serta PCC 8927 TaxID=671068 RepID=A0A7Z9BXE5_9CYAN|nr:metallophosphoesterase [Planktothrix serta]VXD24528.1 Ser/Thr protein phosphatase family protein [Planktothrix serta PCC 8927]
MYPLLTGKLKIEQLTVAIANLPPKLSGIKLVQLTDFHYDGLRLSKQLLKEAIAVTNQAKPDLIVLTGDYVTHDPTPIHQLTVYLKQLYSKAGVYGVLGNHDHYYSYSKKTVTDALNEIGIQVLCNQIAYPMGVELALIGLGDLKSKQFQPHKVMNTLDEKIPRIILSHNPDTAEILQQWRVDLQLSGHTHGGQIVLPKLGVLPSLLPSIRRHIPQPFHRWIPFFSNCNLIYKHWNWASGLHQVGNNYLYVNRGLGTYLPGRWNCPPEVTIITLKSKV